MTYQFRNVVIAIVLGLLAAVLTLVYVTNYRKHVQHGQQNVGVLVAATDIPAGTSGAQIVAGHMLKQVTVTRTALVPGAISSPEQIAHLVSTDEVMAGEQVSTRRFGNSTELGVRAQLKGTMRAVQVSANPNQILVGTLRARRPRRPRGEPEGFVEQTASRSTTTASSFATCSSSVRPRPPTRRAAISPRRTRPSR